MCHLYADPATIPSLRYRKALGHREWSQLSLTISDIGLRGLTLLCRECFVTRFKFCPMTSPWPSPDHAMGYPISGMGTNPAREMPRDAHWAGRQSAPPALVEIWDQGKPALVQGRDVLRLRVRFMQLYSHEMENFITSKEQRSWKTEIPHIPALWLQGALHCLALGISLVYYFIFQIFWTVPNLKA